MFDAFLSRKTGYNPRIDLSATGDNSMFHFEFPPQSDKAAAIKRYLNRQTRRLADGLDLLAATADDDGAFAEHAASDSGLTDYFPCAQDYFDVAQFAGEEFVDSSPVHGALATFSDHALGVDGTLYLPNNGGANFSVRVRGMGAESAAIEVSDRANARLKLMRAATVNADRKPQ